MHTTKRTWFLRIAIACCLVSLLASAPFTARAGKRNKIVKKMARVLSHVNPGDPLAGLSAQDVALFFQGRDNFNDEETVEDGLGPAYNGTSCSVCHSIPAIGGSGIILETRAARENSDGTMQELADGSLFRHFSIPDHQCQPILPPEANIIARRIALPIFGDGLVEAIPDAQILAHEDPNDRNHDGISGRANILLDVATGRHRVGRFGWKAQQATLLAFAGEAYRNENGITNDLFPDELKTGLSPAQFATCAPVGPPEDVVRDETGIRAIDDFENFMRMLAPLPRGSVGASEFYGEVLFGAVGCASCHVPSMTTGPSQNPVFNRRQVNLFSDLLLHDIGTGDGIPQGHAKPGELRTPPLWGVRFRRSLLHDGRSASFADAIQFHRGEANATRQRFDSLTPAQKKHLLAFLDSL